MIIEVALAVPLYRLFDYRIEHAEVFSAIKPGMRVLVPFGRRQLVGIVLKKKQQASVSAHELKTISDWLDQTPLLDEITLKLLQWANNYYQYPIGEVVVGTLPKALRQGKDLLVPPEAPANLDAKKAALQLTAEQAPSRL